MESRESSETSSEDREEGTPQGQLMSDEPGSSGTSGGDSGTPEEGGADSVGDAEGEGG